MLDPGRREFLPRARVLQCPIWRKRRVGNNLDPELVSATFGMTAEGVLAYFADRIDPTLEDRIG